jgi:peptidoglycan hydrolase CwlO-like protein
MLRTPTRTKAFSSLSVALKVRNINPSTEMIKKKFDLLAITSLGILLCFFLSLGHLLPINAEECGCNAGEDELACTKSKQTCLKEKIAEKQSQAQTLSNIISVLNNQISVQELQIKQTKLEIAQLDSEIDQLTNRISGLNVSLDRMSLVLIERANAGYRRRNTNPFLLLVSSDSIENFVQRYKYHQIAQAHTTDVMKQAETQKIDYDQQKDLKEKKQKEVEQKRQLLQQQQNQLTSQRADQQSLLTQTKNDEARYQTELEKTLAEQGAIKSIVAGRGNEEKVGDVKEGDKIATVIQGSSTCSNGTHLHFEVVKDGAHNNPSGYLKSIPATWNNSPDGTFGFGGDWNWPLNNPAKINQGYGMTWFARVRRSYGGAPHTGIDMMSKDGDTAVKAVKEGTLYRGGISCGRGTLRYVKVEHKESNISTYYLHVNY